MSEMVANKGIIKELFPNLKTLAEKVKAEAKRQGVEPEDIASNYYEDEWDVNDYRHYAIISNRLFDISDAPDDDDYGYSEKIRRLNDTELEIDLYYYNGGTCMEEIVADWLDKEEKNGKPKVFYAVKMLKFGDGEFWSRGSSPTPALFLTEGRALGTVKANTAYTDEELEVVRFVQQ